MRSRRRQVRRASMQSSEARGSERASDQSTPTWSPRAWNSTVTSDAVHCTPSGLGELEVVTNAARAPLGGVRRARHGISNQRVSGRSVQAPGSSIGPAASASSHRRHAASSEHECPLVNAPSSRTATNPTASSASFGVAASQGPTKTPTTRYTPVASASRGGGVDEPPTIQIAATNAANPSAMYPRLRKRPTRPRSRSTRRAYAG